MSAPVLFLLLAILLPLLGSVVLLLAGTKMGVPLAGWIGTTFILLSFGCTLFTMVKWYEGKHGGIAPWGMAERPIIHLHSWVPHRGGPPWHRRHSKLLDAGIYVDSLTIAMFAMITLIAAVIHIFSLGFMTRDPRFARFFACMGFCCSITLALVASATLLQITVCLLLLGLTACLLLGFHHESASARAGAIKASAVLCIGGCGLLIGLGLLAAKLGTTSLPALWTLLGPVASGHPVRLPGGGVLSTNWLTFAGIALFCGAAVCSAQFPFHVWFTGMAAAPAPAAALLASSATAAAGVYLVGRLFPILSPDARLLIAILGLTTVCMSALIALAQNNLRRLLAWAAVSQFGYMVLAMGVGSWIGGLFHLLTSAFIIASLFLAAASVEFATAGNGILDGMGGLWRKLPITAGIFAIGALAMAGAAGFSGRYSQANVMTDAAAFAIYAIHTAGRDSCYWLFFILPAIAAFVLAFALARCWMLVFAGGSRSAGTDVRGGGREHPILWGPMLALAIPSIIAGYAMNIPELLRASVSESKVLCNEWLNPAGAGKAQSFTAFDQAWPAGVSSSPAPEGVEPDEVLGGPLSPAAEAHERGRALQQAWLPWTWALAAGLAIALYWNGCSRPQKWMRFAPLRWVHAWLDHEMYFNELYVWSILRPMLAIPIFGRAIGRWLRPGRRAERRPSNHIN